MSNSGSYSDSDSKNSPNIRCNIESKSSKNSEKK